MTWLSRLVSGPNCPGAVGGGAWSLMPASMVWRVSGLRVSVRYLPFTVSVPLGAHRRDAEVPLHDDQVHGLPRIRGDTIARCRVTFAERFSGGNREHLGGVGISVGGGGHFRCAEGRRGPRRYSHERCARGGSGLLRRPRAPRLVRGSVARPGGDGAGRAPLRVSLPQLAAAGCSRAGAGRRLPRGRSAAGRHAAVVNTRCDNVTPPSRVLRCQL